METLLFLAVLVERLIELVFGQIFEKVPALQPYKWTQIYLAIALGIVASVSYQLDLLELVGQAHSTFGVVLTGVAVGGGSSLLHDIVSGLAKKSGGVG